jgi:AcrR family transcriptional regulator
MARPRFANVDAKVRARVLETARDEIAAKGYEAASLNRILLKAGLSKGAFYYYFDDKLDLAATLMLELGRPLAISTELRMPRTRNEFWKELRSFSYRQLKLLEANSKDYECMMRLANAVVSDPKLAQQVMPMFAPGRARMAKFLEVGVKLGALRDDLSVPVLMAMMEAVKTAAYKGLYPGDVVLSDVELAGFTGLIIDLFKRITAPTRYR